MSRRRVETETGFGELSGSGLRLRPKLGLSVGLKSRLRCQHVVCNQVRCYESDLRKKSVCIPGNGINVAFLFQVEASGDKHQLWKTQAQILPGDKYKVWGNRMR